MRARMSRGVRSKANLRGRTARGYQLERWTCSRCWRVFSRRQLRAKSFFRSFSMLYGLDVASDGNGYDLMPRGWMSNSRTYA